MMKVTLKSLPFETEHNLKKNIPQSKHTLVESVESVGFWKSNMNIYNLLSSNSALVVQLKNDIHVQACGNGGESAELGARPTEGCCRRSQSRPHRGGCSQLAATG